MPPKVHRNTHCAICARPLPDRTGKRGKPASYCQRKVDGKPTGAPCQDLDSLLRRTEAHVEKVIDRLPRDEDGNVTPEGRKAAMLLRRKLHWDPSRRAFKDDAEANAHAIVSRAQREPWTIEA